MKLTIPLLGLMTVATAGLANAGEVLVEGQRVAPGLNVAERAFDACAYALVEQLLPGQDVRVRTQLQAPTVAHVSAAVDDKQAEASSVGLLFTMQARLKHDGSLLATGHCTVSGGDVKLGVSMVPAAKLAGLKPKDIFFAAVRR